MKIAVVILNWNGKSLLEQFLPAVMKYSSEAKIYVADNASSDDSILFLKDNYPEITIIQNTENGGYAKGYNDALQHVVEPIYALVNSDIEVTEGWLAPILTEFESNSETAIIQPKILDYKNKDYFEYAGAAGGFIDKYGYPFCRGRVFETLEKDKQQYDDNTTIFWASGACLFIRKEVFQALNGFDESFFAHQEEIDLCWRAFNLGYSAKYIASSIVYHVGGATLQAYNARKTFLNFRNSLLMLLKNLPKNRLFPILFSRLVLDGIAGIRFITQFKFSHFFAIIKAHFSFYARFFSTKKKRSKKLKGNYFYTSSLIHTYFIKKKRKFSEILSSH